MPIRKSILTPSTRLIIQFLETATIPQSNSDVAAGTNVSYWSARTILKDLVKKGLLQESMQGSSPRFFLSPSIGKPVTVEARSQYVGTQEGGSTMIGYPGLPMVVPTGSVEERMIWAAMCRISTDWNFTSWRHLQAETGSSWSEIDAAINKLVARGIAERWIDEEGIHLFRLQPEYQMQFALVYRRLFPNAQILGGPKPYTLKEDIHAMYYFIGYFPLKSLLAFAVTKFPQYVTAEAREIVARALAAEAEKEKLSQGKEVNR
jgi:hypothetical protein